MLEYYFMSRATATAQFIWDAHTAIVYVCFVAAISSVLVDSCFEFSQIIQYFVTSIRTVAKSQYVFPNVSEETLIDRG